jgi:hypothetical protein
VGSNSQVGRNFEFALTVRDVAVGGQTASDLMTLTATSCSWTFCSFKPKQPTWIQGDEQNNYLDG